MARVSPPDLRPQMALFLYSVGSTYRPRGGRRNLEANPFVLEFSFPQPRPITGIAADFGSMDLTMTVLLYAPGSDTPVKLSQSWVIPYTKGPCPSPRL